MRSFFKKIIIKSKTELTILFCKFDMKKVISRKEFSHIVISKLYFIQNAFLSERTEIYMGFFFVQQCYEIVIFFGFVNSFFNYMSTQTRFYNHNTAKLRLAYKISSVKGNRNICDTRWIPTLPWGPTTMIGVSEPSDLISLSGACLSKHWDFDKATNTELSSKPQVKTLF